MTKVAFVTPIPSPFVEAVAKNLEKLLPCEVCPLFFEDMSHRKTWGKMQWQGFQAEGPSKGRSKQVYAELERISPEVVLVSGYSLPAYRAGRSYALKHKALFIPSLVEAPIPCEGIRRILKYGYIRWFMSAADGIACMGPRACQDYSRVFSGPIIEAPYAFDAGLFEDHVRPRSEGPDGLTFLYSGGLVERRAPILAVKAFAELCSRRDERIYLTISGRGPQEAEVRQVVKSLGLEGAVLWKNDFEDWYDLMNLYRSSDVLVCPNSYSTWNLTIQEAMFSGLGLVSTWSTEGACALIVNHHNGFLVKPDDVEALAFAMEKYCLEPDLAIRHGKLSRSIAQTVDAKEVAARLGQLIGSLL